MPTASHAVFAVVCLALATSQAADGQWWWASAAFTVFAGHVLALADDRARRKRARAWAAAGRQAAEGLARGMAQQHATRKEQPK